MTSTTLLCHPQTPTDAVRGIAARVRRSANGTLALTFVLDADLERLRIPPPGTPGVTHGLWQHTCLEAFIALNDTPGYHEFNFSPSREWAMYVFARYREIASVPDEPPSPAITVRQSPNRLELDAAVQLSDLSAVHAAAPLRLGLSAVIEDATGRLSYWALRHPAGTADFHHPESFTLAVGVPGVDSRVDPR